MKIKAQEDRYSKSLVSIDVMWKPAVGSDFSFYTTQYHARNNFGVHGFQPP